MGSCSSGGRRGSPILQPEQAGKEGGNGEESDDALQNVREYFFKLPLDEQEKVKAEAIKKLPEWTRELLKKCSAKIAECIILSAVSEIKIGTFIPTV